MFRSFALSNALLSICCLIGSLSFAASQRESAVEVDFFPAIKAGDVGVTVIPQDASRVTIQLENRTDRPLKIRVPESIGVVPVLAQPGNFFNPIGGPGGGVIGGAGGGPFGGNQGAQGLGTPMVNQNNMFPGGPIFNVPPGKIIKKRLPALCLEFGKPDPLPRMLYQVQPLEQLCDDPAIGNLLRQYGREEISNRIAQIAAWHIANDLTWQQLAGLTHQRANGTKTARFTKAEIDLAKRVIDHLPKAEKETFSYNRSR